MLKFIDIEELTLNQIFAYNNFFEIVNQFGSKESCVYYVARLKREGDNRKFTAFLYNGNYRIIAKRKVTK